MHEALVSASRRLRSTYARLARMFIQTVYQHMQFLEEVRTRIHRFCLQPSNSKVLFCCLAAV